MKITNFKIISKSNGNSGQTKWCAYIREQLFIDIALLVNMSAYIFKKNANIVQYKQLIKAKKRYIIKIAAAKKILYSST